MHNNRFLRLTACYYIYIFFFKRSSETNSSLVNYIWFCYCSTCCSLTAESNVIIFYESRWFYCFLHAFKLWLCYFHSIMMGLMFVLRYLLLTGDLKFCFYVNAIDKKGSFNESNDWCIVNFFNMQLKLNHSLVYDHRLFLKYVTIDSPNVYGLCIVLRNTWFSSYLHISMFSFKRMLKHTFRCFIFDVVAPDIFITGTHF